ncbi:MAG: malto-oligosyltrehalose synthase [Frankiales bacterium]|nr:malto-oligosyltrehalose synthase [Frankiales bacterium]
MASSRTPVSTYRLQLTAEFTFDHAAAVVPYLAHLGVTHLYCSPWLESAPGSQHGYDVVDHSRVDTARGGQEGLDRLVAACHTEGLGIVLDVVPNHMSVAHERLNAAWWSLLREGSGSPYASWFDVDWSKGPLLLPVLGKPLAESLDELSLREDRIVYHEHEFPVAPGTLVEGDVVKTLAEQHYRLAFWRCSDELSYRRFFDVTTLAALRVELPAVFDATHALILQQVHDGLVDGLRIDHPDGLADPEGYLARLSERAPGTWVVAEKILEPGEALPAWCGAGTTGYDSLQQVMGLFVDPAGQQVLDDLWDGPSYDEVVEASKRLVLEQVLVAEVDRLVDVALPALEGFDVSRHGLRAAAIEVLVAFDVYRAYLGPSGPADANARAQVEAAVARAQVALPHRAREAALVGRLALAELECPEFVTRFQQTCGPVMAKGVEDTAFYRYVPLSALCEVGGDPSVFGTAVAEFHAWCTAQQEHWPLSMTTLSTHDTKRSEDVRARLVLLSQRPRTWLEAVSRWTAQVTERLDQATEQLVWQTLVGAWPLSADRAVAYLEKATREAKSHTSWTDPDQHYDARVASFVRGILADRALCEDLAAFVEDLAPAWRLTALAQKLVQLTMPGVADTYQGTEFTDLSLVDPDNRRPVDFARRAALLEDADSSVDADKLRVVSSCLRLRRARPEWFVEGSSYQPIEAGPDALAFGRSGQVITVVPLRAAQGIPGGTVALPDGEWQDALCGERWSGRVEVRDLLRDFGVSLLVRR